MALRVNSESRSSSSAASPSCPHCMSPFDALEASEAAPIPSDLLTTHRPPLDPEILCIQSAIIEQRAHKTRWDARISALQDSLTKLIADREILEEKIRNHEGTLSPLRRMPTELLSPSHFHPTSEKGTQFCGM
ncbi:hypothetical protein C8R44DRAFT_790720 [Mycena epipterygia]|nr:hypothetical protein C8R44DRAFT_790720 [Mycena epipterygia]